jgi:hypothetical protein
MLGCRAEEGEAPEMSNTKSEFSEFTYGFALTHELLSGPAGQFLRAPQFPSLRDEGKKYGYDVKIQRKGKPLFIQFKLSEPMLTRAAREYRDLSFRIPCYRMHFWPRRKSKQHTLLSKLEQNNRGSVFYYAPAFWMVRDLDRYFASKSIESNSRRARPSELPIPRDKKSHHLSFESARGKNVNLYSDEPHGIESDERTLIEVLAKEVAAVPANESLGINLLRLERWFIEHHLVHQGELSDETALRTQGDEDWRLLIDRLASWTAIHLDSSLFLLQTEQ